MRISPADVTNWKKRLNNLMPANYGQALHDISDISQAVSLVQAYGVYSFWVQRGFTKQDKEDALRSIFPNLPEGKPKW